jgi:putative ABC transport system permease protein
MSLVKFSLKEITARPLRVLFTFLSIAIGVGAVVAVLLATSTTRRAQQDMLRSISGNADLEVVADGESFEYELVQQARQVEGVRWAVPSFSRFAVLFYGERRARTQVLGIDPRIDQNVRDYTLVAGRQPTVFSEILLDSSFAHSLGVQVGSEVKLFARGGTLEFTVVGLVRPSGSGAIGLSSAAYLVLNSAQALFDVRNQINMILIDVDDEADVEAVRHTLQAGFGDGVTVRQPRTSSDMARETMYATENGLQLAIAFALLQAVFIIYNTFQMAVGERRRQLGILRAIGATRWQVAAMILREALLVSILASIAGSFFGVWGAGWLNMATEQVLQVSLPRVQLTWWPFLIAVSLGIGVSLLGASLPARRASTVAPIEAIRAIELTHNQEVIRYTRIAAFITFPAGIALFLLNLTGGYPVGTDAVAIVLMLLGCVLFIPAILEPWSATAVQGLSSVFGVEIKLAQRQLIRHVGRATLTIGVLFIAMSTSAGLAGNILDNVTNVRNWYQRSIAGDFFVRATMPDLATGTAADMPPEVGAELATIPGIATIDPMRFANVQSGEESILLVIRSFEQNRDPVFDLVAGTDREAVEGLLNEQVVIGTVLAQRMRLSVGDMLSLETQEGTVQIPVAAIANDYIGGGLTAYIERQFAVRLLGIDGVDAYVIQAEPGERESLELALQDYTQQRGLILQSYAELINLIDSMINGVIASLWMLLALGSMISAMGLVNTLTMNILEQTREIGMLRVIAMTRSQVRRMILAQAILIGLIGLVPGCLAGVGVAYAISLSSYAVLGHEIVFHFRPLLFAACLLGAALVVLIASLLPANRAARLRLADALQYE